MKFKILTSVIAVLLLMTLAIPVQPAALGYQDYHFGRAQMGRLKTFSAADNPVARMKLASYGDLVGTAACAVAGRPCGGTVRCCPGLVCKFKGGSTRVGYQCAFRGSASVSASAVWDELSMNRLD